MTEKSKKIIKYVISLAVAALFIWLVVRKVDWSSFWEGLKQTQWIYMALYIIVSILALVFRAGRWRELLMPFDKSTKMIDTWDAGNVGNVANIGLPGIGEFIRCGLITSGETSYEKSLGTIVMERIWDAFSIVLLLVISLSLKWNDFGQFFNDNIVGSVKDGHSLNLWWIVALVVVLLLAFIWIVFRYRERNIFCGKVANSLGGMKQGLSSFFKMKRKFAFILYTVGIWIMYILMTYFGLKAVPALSELTIVDALFISAIGNLASIIPVPSGMGPYHYLVMLTLSSVYGCTGETGLLFAVLEHETHAILIGILGLASYTRFTIRKNRNYANDHSE